MTPRHKRILIITLILAAALAMCLFAVCAAIISGLRTELVGAMNQQVLYPSPPPMPAVVPESTDELLAQLETVLQKRAPTILKSLQPGLSDTQIAQLEKQAGLALTDDLRALYKWHNGMSGRVGEFIPTHRFMPLEEAIQNQAAMQKDLQKGNAVRRAVGGTLLAHRLGWLPIFADPAGDGYYYDPDRRSAPGSFFYNFAEDGSYLFFPSTRNFLAGAIECFEKGISSVKPDGSLAEDFNASQSLWLRYGAPAPR